MTPVLVTGASSQIGYFLLPRLLATGVPVIAISRRPPPNWAPTGVVWRSPSDWPKACPTWLHLAPLWLLPDWLAAAPAVERVVAFGSTSMHSKAASPDPHERAVAARLAAAEQAVAAIAQSRAAAWTILRPTLVYGCGLDHSLTTMAGFIRRWGFFPRVGPALGRRQPVHADDLAHAVLQVLAHPASAGRAYDVAGGETLTYRNLIERVFCALDRPPRWLPLPQAPLAAALAVAAHLPGGRHLSAGMASRFAQDLCFDHRAAQQDFGYAPRPCLLTGAMLRPPR